MSDVSVIPDTPEFMCPPPDVRAHLTGKPALGTFYHSPIDKNAKKYQGSALKRPRVPSIVKRLREQAAIRCSNQANTYQQKSPFSRFGNYDNLNYAPIDQKPLDKDTNLFGSLRSRQMAAQAATQYNLAKRRRLQVVNENVSENMSSVEENFDHNININSQENSTTFTEKSVNAMEKIADLTVDRFRIHGMRIQTCDPFPINLPLDAQDDILNEILLDIVPFDTRSTCSSKHEVSRNVTETDKKEFETRETRTYAEQSTNGGFVDDFDTNSSLINDSFLNAAIYDLPSIHKLESNDGSHCFCSYYRGRVCNLAHQRDGLLVTISHKEFCSQNCQSPPLKVDLQGTWADLPLSVGDIVNFVPASNALPEPAELQWCLSDSNVDSKVSAVGSLPDLLILHPDLLLSGTTVVSSLTCLRRSVLEQFWFSGGESCSTNTISDGSNTTSNPRELMFIGTIVHQIFQKVIHAHKLVFYFVTHLHFIIILFNALLPTC